jgi:parallel beta-helix repeat protein
LDDAGELEVSATLLSFSVAHVLGKGATLKAFVLVSALVLVLVVLPYSSLSGWLLTVGTDRPYYTLGDRVFISGVLVYGGWPEQNVPVSVDVYMPGGGVCFMSATTNSSGQYSVSFTLGGPNAGLGQYNVSASTSPDGTTVTASTTFLVVDRIYITSNGDVEPSSAPISRSGDTYRLTKNVTGNLVDGVDVQRSNVVLDGAGFAVSTTNKGGSYGIYLTSVSNVTVWNVSVQSFQDGVFELSCSNCDVAESSLFNDGYGVCLQQSSFNTVEANNITKNTSAGIFLETSNSNIVFHNNFFNNTCQAYCSGSSGNSWDDGYPSGGNFWSDYQTRFPNASEIDGSGIWNTPYAIDSVDVDCYPLMNPWGSAEPVEASADVHLLLSVNPGQVAYARNQLLTLDVSVLNQLNPSFNSTLTLTVTGPGGYYCFDFQTVKVTANAVGEYAFSWTVPNVAGTYYVEVGLVPLELTAYDAVWLSVA